MRVKKDSGLFIGDVDVAPASGTIQITENGEHNVAQYAMAEVDVAVGITVNESYDISGGTLNSATFTLNQGFTEYIPDGVTILGGKAFQYNTLITNVEMPNSVLTIENGAMYGPIGFGCFYGCINLTNIKLSENLISIGNFAFSDCTSLTLITIPDGVTTIGEYAFKNCTSLTSITIPDSVTSIEEYAFGDCTSLTDIYYTGTQAEWEQITISTDAIPAGATIHYEYTP